MIFAVALALAAAVQPAMPVIAPDAVAPPMMPVRFAAEDGVVIHGDYHPAFNARAIVLLFHQADSGRGEYASIAPKLAAAGYSALAIDQRAGGALYGRNDTAAGLGRKAGYLEAKRDLEAALRWSRRMEVPVFLVGSSYSSSLALIVAAENPEAVAGVVAFSPGEYFGRDSRLLDAAARVRAPTLLVTTAEEGELLRAAPVEKALIEGRAPLDRQILARGKHGATTLIEAANPQGAREALVVLLRWLRRYTVPGESI